MKNVCETYKKLNAKQIRFCEEYIIDNNATQAAIRAGYSKQTSYSIGFNLLKKVEIKSYIKQLKNIISKQINYTVQDSFNMFEKIQKMALYDNPDEKDETKLTRKDKQDLTAASNAEKEKARLLGLFELDNNQNKDVVQITQQQLHVELNKLGLGYKDQCNNKDTKGL